MYSYPVYTTDLHKDLCTAHGTYKDEGLNLPLQQCLTDFPTQPSQMLYKSTSGMLGKEKETLILLFLPYSFQSKVYFA